MIGITNSGGGGNGAWRITTVYGGVAPPSNPKEFDIFINTSVPLGAGEITTNVIAKPVWSAAQGTWYIGISSGTFPNSSSAYFAQNRRNGHGISGFPNQAWQMINGQWWKTNAYTWFGGRWVQFSSTYNGELFYLGNQYTDVTGGWKPNMARMYPWNEGWGMATPTMEIGTNMVVYQASNPVSGTIFTGTSIDVTNYRTLKANVQYNLRGAGKNNGFWLGVTTETGDQYHPLASFMAQTDTGEKSYDGDISIDISGITGRVFVFIAVVRHTHVSQFGTNPVTFRKIWLE